MHHSYFLSNMRQVTIQKNLDTVYMFQNYLISIQNSCWGEMDCYQFFFIFPVEKKLNQLKTKF